MIYKIDKNELNLDEFGIKYGFMDGSIDFNTAGPAVESARKEFLNIVSEDYSYEVKQSHSVNINVLDEKFKEKAKNSRSFFDNVDADGVFTGDKGIVLCIRTADCVPVLFAGFKGKTATAVGAVHCGWKGSYGGIIKNAVSIMISRFNIDACSILAVIGPSICKKCYEVKEDFLNLFLKQNNLNINFFQQKIEGGKNKIFFDLKSFIKNELIFNGLNGKNIFDINKCTMENENFFSYRRNKTDKRQVSFISIEN
jgi:YfiH family protein